MQKENLRKVMVSDLTYGKIEGYFHEFLITDNKTSHNVPCKKVEVLAELSNGKIDIYPIGRVQFID